MYIVNRRWLYSTIAVCVVLVLVYVDYTIWDLPRGGSFKGYLLGIVGALLVVILMLLPARKRQYQRPVGSLDLWMRSHVCLGIITALIVGMHAGFQMVGTISVGLSLVFILTLISGLIGTVLYEILPSTIARMGNNTFRKQAHLASKKEMGQELEELLKGQTVQFKDVVTNIWTRKKYPASFNPFHLVSWWLRHRRIQNEEQDSGQLSESEQVVYLTAEMLLTRFEQLDRQIFYQKIVRQWLWLHIPLSAALMTLLLVHIITTLYY